MRLDLSFGWKERAAVYRRRRGKRWRRLGVVALAALVAAMLWYGPRLTPWLRGYLPNF